MANELAKIAKDIGSFDQLKTMDKYLQVVNQNPPEEWVEDHPLAAGVKYLPIDKVELMLTEMYQEWHVEILREGQILNAVYCAVRLHYKMPTTGEWTFQDGIGAVPIKVTKGENASNLSAILFNAILTGLPAAKSFAIKDAADHIGVVFGRNLNRKDTIDFKPSYDDTKEQIIEEAIEKLNSAKTLDELKEVFAGLTRKQGLNEKVITAKDIKKIELQKENK